MTGDRSSFSCFVTLLAVLKAIFVFLMMMIMTCVVHFLRLIHRCFGVKTEKIDPTFYEDWFSVNLGYQAFRTIFRDNRLDVACMNKVNSDAPNITLFSLENKEMKLLDFQKSGRPLIINFGSCS
jgi:hypothetical protein